MKNPEIRVGAESELILQTKTRNVEEISFFSILAGH
jgi:hypothetical protein